MSQIEKALVPQIDRLLEAHLVRNHPEGHHIPRRPQLAPLTGRRHAERGVIREVPALVFVSALYFGVALGENEGATERPEGNLWPL